MEAMNEKAEDIREVRERVGEAAGSIDAGHGFEHCVPVREADDSRFTDRIPGPGLILDRRHRGKRTVAVHDGREIDGHKHIEYVLDRSGNPPADFDHYGLQRRLLLPGFLTCDAAGQVSHEATSRTFVSDQEHRKEVTRRSTYL